MKVASDIVLYVAQEFFTGTFLPSALVVKLFGKQQKQPEKEQNYVCDI